MTIVVPHLESEPGWQTHIPSDGSDIGGNDPSAWLRLQNAAGLADGMFLDVTGPAYAAVEHYLLTPIVTPNTGNLVLSYGLTVDANAVNCAQSIETDTILCVGGFNYNLSLQVNYQERGMIQIANQSGGWTDTGKALISYPPFLPQAAYKVRIAYRFNLTTKTSQVVSYTLNGVEYPISLLTINAVEKGWADGALVQVQQGLNAQGGSFSMLMNNLQYEWS